MSWTTTSIMNNLNLNLLGENAPICPYSHPSRISFLLTNRLQEFQVVNHKACPMILGGDVLEDSDTMAPGKCQLKHFWESRILSYNPKIDKSRDRQDNSSQFLEFSKNRVSAKAVRNIKLNFRSEDFQARITKKFLPRFCR
jgi:hypothetical protein